MATSVAANMQEANSFLAPNTQHNIYQPDSENQSIFAASFAKSCIYHEVLSLSPLSL